MAELEVAKYLASFPYWDYNTTNTYPALLAP